MNSVAHREDRSIKELRQKLEALLAADKRVAFAYL
jgi:hypothetical protein